MFFIENKFIQHIHSKDKYSLILFIFCSLFFFIFNIFFIEIPILEQHAFRQTQTALTAYYFIENGFSFDYDTPVIGYPWSIPLEFPIYQYIVAVVSSFFEISLTIAGRLISLIFSYLSVIPIYFSLKELNFSKSNIFYVLTLIYTAPLYIFWSGSFMIESTALFFSLCFIFCCLKISYKHNNVIYFMFGFIFLTLAFLQKITTIFPIYCIFFLYFISNLKNNKNLKYIFKLFLLFTIPLIIGLKWIAYSDSIKELHPIGYTLTSEAQRSWTLGNIDQRFSLNLWVETIWNRTLIGNTASIFGLVAILFVFFVKTKEKIKAILIFNLVLFLFPFLIFSNLHIIHNYYQYANLIFYIVAIGIATIVTLEYSITQSNFMSKINVKFVKLIIFTFFILISYSLFIFNDYAKSKLSVAGPWGSPFFNHQYPNKTLLVADFVKNNTDADLPIVIYGYDWSSELAFYSERKALTVPSWTGKNSFFLESINDVNKFLPNMEIGAVIDCFENDEIKSEIIEKKYIKKNKKFIKSCRIYY